MAVAALVAFVAFATTAVRHGPRARRAGGGQGQQLVFVQLFGIHQLFVGAFHGQQQIVQLQVQRAAVLVLVLLDQEHHQERDDGGAGVDHQLPGFGIAEDGAGNGPQQHGAQGRAKRDGRPRPMRDMRREMVKEPGDGVRFFGGPR
ncbi:hypothetical protein D3C71_1719770 [compost metagenome]